jgi:hypothetical protein
MAPRVVSRETVRQRYERKAWSFAFLCSLRRHSLAKPPMAFLFSIAQAFTPAEMGISNPALFRFSPHRHP